VGIKGNLIFIKKVDLIFSFGMIAPLVNKIISFHIAP